MSYDYKRQSSNRDSRSVQNGSMGAAWHRANEEVVELKEQASPIGSIPGERLAEHLYSPGVAAGLRADTRHNLIATGIILGGIWAFLLLTIGLYSLLAWRLWPVATIFWLGVFTLPACLLYQAAALLDPGALLNRSWIAHKIADAGSAYADARVDRIRVESLGRKVEISRHAAALNAQQQLLAEQIALGAIDERLESKLTVFMSEVSEQITEKLEEHLQRIAPPSDSEAWIDEALSPVSDPWVSNRVSKASPGVNPTENEVYPKVNPGIPPGKPTTKKVTEEERRIIESMLRDDASNGAIRQRLGWNKKYSPLITRYREELDGVSSQVNGVYHDIFEGDSQEGREVL